eukprot:6396712-Alexandrium_andersonii.AAC.1
MALSVAQNPAICTMGDPDKRNGITLQSGSIRGTSCDLLLARCLTACPICSCSLALACYSLDPAFPRQPA